MPLPQQPVSGTPQTITIPLYEHLEDKIRHHEYAVISYDRAKLIQSVDPNEVLCHVHYPGEQGTDNGDKCPLVYYKKTWVESSFKWHLDKERSARERLAANLRTEKMAELMKGIIRTLPVITDMEIVKNLAGKIYDEKKVEVAKQFGVTL